MIDTHARLAAAVGADRVRRNAPLAPLTTFKVGGPADWLVDVHHGADLEKTIAIARDARIPITVLGGGSNVLVSDSGVRGIVVRVHGRGAVQHNHVAAFAFQLGDGSKALVIRFQCEPD